MLEIARRTGFHPARRSERSLLHDVRQPAQPASFDADRAKNINFRTSRSMAWRSSRDPAGGARRDRTDDLLLAKQALSQLSYGPLFSGRLKSERKAGLPSRSSRAAVARLRPFGLRRGSLPSQSDRRLVGLGRFELPTSRLSSARSNQLSYKPLIWRTAEITRTIDEDRATHPARARPRRKRNEDGGVPPMGMYGLSRHALMFPRDPIATA